MRKSTYSPICHHLAFYRPVKVVYSFQGIERLLNRKLPESAYTHQAWWSNHSSHTQAKHGWLAADYFAKVDINAQEVTFTERHWLWSWDGGVTN